MLQKEGNENSKIKVYNVLVNQITHTTKLNLFLQKVMDKLPNFYKTLIFPKVP